MSHSPILVIGSTGKTGRRIIQRLSEKGHTVRKGSRQSDPPFDWEKPGTWQTALRGVEAVYISFFPDLAVPGAPAAIEEFTSCAITAGVKRIVLLSGRGEVNAQRCENIVRECGASFTLIRASWFSQNFDEFGLAPYGSRCAFSSRANDSTVISGSTRSRHVSCDTGSSRYWDMYALACAIIPISGLTAPSNFPASNGIRRIRVPGS